MIHNDKELRAAVVAHLNGRVEPVIVPKDIEYPCKVSFGRKGTMLCVLVGIDPQQPNDVFK